MATVSVVSVWICVTIVVFAMHGSPAVHMHNTILYQIDANGSAVVLQAIGSLQQCKVLGNDNELLRRIAYIETRDGTLTIDSNDGAGGIWAVKENKFLQTQSMEAESQLLDKFQQIQNAFGINWMSVQWRDLRMPLYSMIAARLVLYLVPQAQTIPPANDLEAQARFWVQHYNTDGDENEFIGVSSALQGGILDSSANEFFLGFTLNFQIDRLNPLLQLFVTTTESSPVNFTVNATGFSYSGIATQNLSTQVTLPNSLQVIDTNERNKGIYVKAEEGKNIVVYGLNYGYTTTDAFLALPCHHLPIDEYEYYAVTYTRYLRYRSAILIVACEDNTVVNTGQSATIPLNRFQTYLIRSPNDLTGRRITTNKPIALFSNHECAQVPVGNSGCDHLTEQLPPTSTWGRIFFAASLLGRISGEVFRIVATESPTTITVNCTTFTEPMSYFLTDAAFWQEFEIQPNSFCSITSTTPILVTQFALGFQRDTVIGEPFLMLIPPVEQFNTNIYAFNSPPMFRLNCITVYVESEYFQPDKIFVDENRLINSSWSQIRGGYITRVRLSTAGDHLLYHLDQDARLGLSVYGFTTDTSYGYPGGLSLTPIQLAIVSFSSATYKYNHSEEVGSSKITITRLGNRAIPIVVLVASSSIQIAACDGSTPASPVVEFQPGETEKQITITVINITRIELYLSTGEGVYLTPFSRTEIVNLNPDNVSDYQTGEARVCVGLNCSCQSSITDFPTTMVYATILTKNRSTTTSTDSGDEATTDSSTDTSRSLCSWHSWCLATGIAAFAVITVMIITVIFIVIKFKTKKQFSDNINCKRSWNFEMEKCDPYNFSECSDQWPQLDDNPIYNEVDENIYDN